MSVTSRVHELYVSTFFGRLLLTMCSFINSSRLISSDVVVVVIIVVVLVVIIVVVAVVAAVALPHVSSCISSMSSNIQNFR